MNAGICGLTSQKALGPYPLLGRPAGIPTPDRYYHPEAMDWLDRVRANGGTASHATTQAVSQFCHAIDGCGLRSRFYRLNLLCGDSLSAALVPLYRSRVPFGAVLGGATDTNNNLVSADYNEAGPSAGVKGNGSNKFIDTGLSPTGIGAASNDFHMSVYVGDSEASGTSRCMIGLALSATETFIGLVTAGTVNACAIPATNARVTSPPGVVEGFLLATSRREGNVQYIRNTVAAVGTGTQVNGAFVSGNILVIQAFGLYSLRRLFRAYSVGVALTNAEAVMYREAMQAFQIAMGRQVL